MATKFNICIPFFPGFYESWAYDSCLDAENFNEELDYYKECYDVVLDADKDLALDFNAYKNNFSEAFIQNIIDNNYYGVNFIKNMDNINFKIESPLFYNYGTDMLYTDVELTENWLGTMVAFIETNKEWFAKKSVKSGHQKAALCPLWKTR